MSQDDYDHVDWRIRTVTRLAKDVSSAYPGGPSHKAGALVTQQSVAKDAEGHLAGFSSPSTVALALSLAVKAAHSARKLHKDLQYTQVPSPWGELKSVKSESLPLLYDYLEECMAALTFSFQALEAFANENISLNISGSYTFKRKNGDIAGTAEVLERALSTEEKLGSLLPEVLKVDKPKGTALWERFHGLKDSRDATIHIKSRDMNPRIKEPGDVNDPTLFHQFLGANPLMWVRTSVDMIDHFMQGEDPPIWLERIRVEIGDKPRRRSTERTGSGLRPRSKRSANQGSTGNS